MQFTQAYLRRLCNNFVERSKKMLDAAKAMKLSAKDLLKLEIIDEIVTERWGAIEIKTQF